MRTYFRLLAMASVLVGCDSGAYTPPKPPSGSACYRLSFSSSSAELKREETAWFMPPDVIALTPQLVEHPARAGAFRVLPDIDPGLPVRRKVAFAEWRTTSTGGVEILWGNGFVGVTLALHRVGHDLQGTATTFSDAPGGIYNASVTARSMACELS